jgi:hypothetical protein
MESDYIYVKHFEGGRTAWVIRLTFGRARIIVGRGNVFIDDSW